MLPSKVFEISSIVPTEIIQNILKFIPRHDINQFAQSCQWTYKISLPILYKHLELGYLGPMRQLQHGVSVNGYLKETIGQHTRYLTLRSQQNRNGWRTRELARILGSNSKVQCLTFSDFQALSTELIQDTISILPYLDQVHYKYCQIVYKQTLIQEHNKISQVVLSWTEFTEKSIPYILFRNIKRVELGSNRNLHEKTNGLLVQSLSEHCPTLTHLTLTLPQVSSSDVCDMITKYGKQLVHLSIKSENILTLTTIAKYTTELESLCLRTIMDEDDGLDKALLMIIRRCQGLKRLEITSNQLARHVPDIMWESLVDEQVSEMMLKERKETSKSIERVRRRGYRSNNIWFSDVSEEALQQRVNYIRSMEGVKKSQVLKSVVWYQNEIFKVKNAF
ncbi:hypothetical protein BD770DRAFT_414397 [Pilaira anomala]|nr:hypothetical protein BD770DRAFT_414397 [Pilaira anomala]